MERIQDNQQYWKVGWRTDASSELFRECKKCGKFNKPTNTKKLNHWDKNCLNCGEKFKAK